MTHSGCWPAACKRGDRGRFRRAAMAAARCPVRHLGHAWWLIGQSLQPLQLLGGVAVLSGAILVQIATRAT